MLLLSFLTRGLGKAVLYKNSNHMLLKFENIIVQMMSSHI
jgi:hypothetical protein